MGRPWQLAYKLTFPYSNNEIEYEVVTLAITFSLRHNDKRIVIQRDLQLVI